jgi:tetratricopeptide (TPR) repeat protein
MRSNKKYIFIISVLIIAVISFGALKYARKNLEIRKGILDGDINYISNVGSNVDRFISTLEEELRNNENNSNLCTKLGAAYIQKARETSDPDYYNKAEDILKRAIETDDNNYLAYGELGSVYLSRHHFKEALELGKKAISINPYSSYIYSIIVDSQVELGMYEEAVKSAQLMIDTRPDLGSYSRVSHIRELYGDMAGAIDAMEMAVTSGAPSSENSAWCKVQLGNLYFNSGKFDDAKIQYMNSLNLYPNYVHGLGGLAKIKMHEGKYEEAVSFYKQAVGKNALPEYLIALGDAYRLTGNIDMAEEQYSRVRFLITMYKQKGIDADLELALFDADHNKNLKESLKNANESLKNGSISIKTYHALAWIQYKTGDYSEAEKNINLALRLNSFDPLMYYHAGLIFKHNGNEEKSKILLNRALMINPYYNGLYE